MTYVFSHCLFADGSSCPALALRQPAYDSGGSPAGTASDAMPYQLHIDNCSACFHATVQLASIFSSFFKKQCNRVHHGHDQDIKQFGVKSACNKGLPLLLHYLFYCTTLRYPEINGSLQWTCGSCALKRPAAARPHEETI